MSTEHLCVVLRTCDHTDVHPERGSRFIDCDKPLLIKKCLISLLNSIKNAEHLAIIELYWLDDNSTEETCTYIKSTIEKFNLKYTYENCKSPGYNSSAYRQFELCKTQSKQWVYCVEDDYLHYPNAIEQMLLMSQKFQSITGNRIAIRPDDDLFVYSPNNPHSRKPSIVLLGEDRHWRTLHCTHNTIFTHKEVFINYDHLFFSLAKYYKNLSIDEDKTINLIWEKIPLFSPIPGLAIHISQNNQPPFTDYKTLWESLEI
jgi:hypothetical protein